MNLRIPKESRVALNAATAELAIENFNEEFDELKAP